MKLSPEAAEKLGIGVFKKPVFKFGHDLYPLQNNVHGYSSLDHIDHNGKLHSFDLPKEIHERVARGDLQEGKLLWMTGPLRLPNLDSASATFKNTQLPPDTDPDLRKN